MFISFAHLCHITLVPCVYCKLIKRGRLAAPPITPPPTVAPRVGGKSVRPNSHPTPQLTLAL